MDWHDDNYYKGKLPVFDKDFKRKQPVVQKLTLKQLQDYVNKLPRKPDSPNEIDFEHIVIPPGLFNQLRPKDFSFLITGTMNQKDNSSN